MSTTNDQAPLPTFPRARQGYARSSVDAHLRDLHRRLAAVTRDRDGLGEQVRDLAAALSELRVQHDRLRTATLSEQAQEVLDTAAAEAAAIVAEGERAAAHLMYEAQRRAEVVDERARQEEAWRRRRLNRERAELAEQKQAMRDQLRSFRALAADTARQLPELAQLMTPLSPSGAGGTLDEALAGTRNSHS